MQNVSHRKSFFSIEIITMLMIMLFAYTGLTKIITHSGFFQQIKTDAHIGAYAKWLSWIIPIAELIVAGLLLIKNTRVAGYYAFIFLMVLFSIFIIATLLNGKTLPCSCGGAIQLLSWKQHLVFNGCFLLLGILAILLHRRINKS